jgi:hypothetical protein
MRQHDGRVRLALDPNMHAPVPDSAVVAGGGSLSAYLLLRAFASGCAALTGVEAISNGIPAFKKPESRNASTTLLWMAAILTFFFIGLTILAHQLGVRHADAISVPAQVAQAVFGRGIVFYGIQGSTALILILAANTSYADFPRLGYILARDKFLPHQFSFRGDRLGFSTGIIVLALAASALLIAFDADVDKLIPLYAVGVFVSFTLSQSGMVVHWLRLREPGWRRSIVVNAVGAIATGVVAIIIGGTKFIDGAWMSMLLMGILGAFFALVRRHYVRLGKQLDVTAATPVSSGARPSPPAVVVPIGDLNKASLQALSYAHTISPRVEAVHIAASGREAVQFRRRWEALVPDTPLTIIDSPATFVGPMVAYLDVLSATEPRGEVVVVLANLVPTNMWEGMLHNRTGQRLKRALRKRPGMIIAEVPLLLPNGQD